MDVPVQHFQSVIAIELAVAVTIGLAVSLIPASRASATGEGRGDERG
jgi:hypothetical protein